MAGKVKRVARAIAWPFVMVGKGLVHPFKKLHEASGELVEKRRFHESRPLTPDELRRRRGG